MSLRGPILSCSEGEGKQYSLAVIEIGDWDMDADANKSVAHGCVSMEAIREVRALIRNDDGTELYPMCGRNGAAMSAQIESIDVTDVALSRANGLFFDSSDFDSTGYNRGWITVLHLCPGD